MAPRVSIVLLVIEGASQPCFINQNGMFTTDQRRKAFQLMETSYVGVRVHCMWCSDPTTGNTVIIVQPPTSPSSEDPDSQAPPVQTQQPIPLPMTTATSGPQLNASSPTSTSPAGEENPGETLPQSKWLVRDTSSFCVSSVVSERTSCILHATAHSLHCCVCPAWHWSIQGCTVGLGPVFLWLVLMWHVRHYVAPAVLLLSASCVCVCVVCGICF